MKLLSLSYFELLRKKLFLYPGLKMFLYTVTVRATIERSGPLRQNLTITDDLYINQCVYIFL